MKSGINLLIAALLVTLGTTTAQENKSLQRVGVNWAKLSDEAQIQLLMDRMNLSAVDRAMVEISENGQTAVVSIGDREIFNFVKRENQWQLHDPTQIVARPAPESDESSRIALAAETFSAGKTFIPTPLSEEDHIDRLSRSVTRTYMERELFSAPEHTVAYYSARIFETSPFMEATYLQVVVDPAWNRILYGSMDRWIKSYDDVAGPRAIAVDAEGRVFVAESGRERVQVLQIDPQDENTTLTYSFSITDMIEPVALAHFDNGSSLDISDDYLYVADASDNTIRKFALEASGASLVQIYDDVDSPLSLAIGRWDGSNTDALYVVDKIGRRLRQYADVDSRLVFQKELAFGPDVYIRSVRTDHFGNVYLVDAVNARVMKYTWDLTFLDQSADQGFEGLSQVDIPFGKISIENEDDYWVGFDQLYALERWTESTGVQRRALGVALRDVRFEIAADLAEVSADFLLTDHADVEFRISDSNGEHIRTVGNWMVTGNKTLNWDRRDEDGYQILDGTFRCEMSATSAYRDESADLAVEFYLPLYVWQNCGALNIVDDEYAVQGQSYSIGASATETIREHEDEVYYRFSGLNPDAEYVIAMEFISPDYEERTQEILAGDGELLTTVTFNSDPVRTDNLTLPKHVYRSGLLDVSIASTNIKTSSVVSQIWLQEVNASFSPQLVENESATPDYFTLGQNYPNPFNPTTTIEYSLPESRHVLLEVFNVVGQRVKVLVDQAHQAGNFQVRWDGKSTAGTSVTSGIYFYRISASGGSDADGAPGRYVETRRMLLIR